MIHGLDEEAQEAEIEAHRKGLVTAFARVRRIEAEVAHLQGEDSVGRQGAVEKPGIASAVDNRALARGGAVRVPKKGQLCGWCGHPVIRHMQAIEEFVPDSREGADPTRLRKQLYHKKKCWSKELRSRIDTERADARLIRSVELAKEGLKEHGGAEVVGGGQISEETLIDLAIRNVGLKAPNLVSERARLITIGEDTELPDELTAALDEEGRPSAKFEVTVEPTAAKRPMVPRGQLKLAIKTAIEARGGSWWTKEQIREDVAMLGLVTTAETIDVTIYDLGKKQPFEQRRVGSGKGYRRCEFRVVQPLPTPPPMLDIPREKVPRAQKVRHSNRPMPWEKLAAEAGSKEGNVVKFTRYEVVDQVIDVTPEKEPVMVQENGHQELSPRVKQAMFMLKSEKMLNELERTMMQLVAETIKSARDQIARLVEEELG
jgi:hypothetical protein